MAIDIHRESLVSLSQASDKLPGNPHSTSLWRWARIGLHGTQLEYVRIGHKILTSLEALDRFANALAAADAAPRKNKTTCDSPRAPRSAARRAELRRTDEILTRDGILTSPPTTK